MGKAVCNTGPVIGLIRINELHLLWDLFDEVYIPEFVYKELTKDKESYSGEINKVEEAIKNGYIKILYVKNQELVRSLYGKLHYGELEVVVGAKEIQADYVIIDEKAARNFASMMMLTDVGIIGILLKAKKLGRVSEVKRYLLSLIGSGYRISKSLYCRALDLAGEKEDEI